MNLKLKFAIIEKYGSQADFAKVMGLSESGLSRIIRGRREPEPELKETIARKLGVSPDEIFPAN
ncbi:MAG: helix-turn-helix transcriptional regulator [Deltaproteobacteria bacterium]|nr:helix-turn-helix transcriptional regulator [Deltaproteobacteria bacterium]